MTARNLTDLTGRVAVVMGGTSGLGRAAAIGLAESGAEVVAVGRRPEMVAEVATAIEATGRRTLRLTADVGSRASLDALRNAVLDEFHRVDILVNAAGITKRTPTAQIPEDEWNSIMDTNLTGTLRACQAFYAALKEAATTPPPGRTAGASIINFASLVSYVAFLEVAAYGASKGAVLALTKQLGCEWCREGIRVNAVVPGVFPTELNSKLLNGTDRGREILQRTPMRRFGRPEELSGAVVFLASDAASFITGQTIAIDGGYLAAGVNS